MITNPQQTSFKYLRKLLVLPVAALVLTLFAFRYKKHADDAAITLAPKPITILLDAGHGGIDPGAKSPDQKYNEATLSLDIAMMIRQLAPEYNINIIMTREMTAQPGGAITKDDGLRKRVEIANSIHPDAFISIHNNSAGKPVFQHQHSGIEAYVSARREDEKGKQLASVLVQELSTVYKTAQELKYRTDRGIWILDQSQCPTVLLQCGFINNPDDLAFFTNKDNQEKIARSILQGIVKSYQSSTSLEPDNHPADTVPRKGSMLYFTPQKVALYADTLIGTIKPKKAGYEPKNSLVIIDGKEAEWDYLATVTINAKEIIMYDQNDPEAIKLYGEKAAKGLLLIKGATIINTPSFTYYNIKPFAPVRDDEDKIFSKVEIDPKFPGGEKAWAAYLTKNLDANIPVKNNAPVGRYTVRIQFIVGKEGKTSDIKPLTNVGYGMEEEVIRVIRSVPNWEPGIQNGHVIKAYTTQTVTFQRVADNKVSQQMDRLPDITLVAYTNTKPGSSSAIPSFTPAEPGSVEWRRYFERNLNINIPVNEGWKPGNYTLFLKFTASKEGTISAINVLSFTGSKTAANCKLVMSKIDKIVPSQKTIADGQTVYLQAFNYIIKDETVTSAGRF